MASPSTLGSSIDEITSAWSTYKNKRDNSTPEAIAARQKLAQAAKALADEAQDPVEKLFEFSFYPMLSAAMRVALGAGLLDDLPNEGAISAEDLAKKTGASRAVIVRIMRVLNAMRFISEPEDQKYCHTPVSRALLGNPNPVKATLEMFGDDIYPVVSYLHEHLKSTEYKEPSIPTEGPYQKLHNINTSFYEHIATKPGHSENFALAMTANSGASFDLSKYPFPEKLAAVEKDEIALVDCGGGRGQVLRELNAIFPSWGAKMMLQDRPEVLEPLKDEKDRGFEIVAHNFYDEQPVRAHAYLFRFTFMDQTDARARTILRSLKPQCVKGHTKLLIIENLVPERDASLLESGFDMIMMCLSSSKMRTAKDFEGLLGSEGFEVDKVWRSDEVGERCLVEAVYRG